MPRTVFHLPLLFLALFVFLAASGCDRVDRANSVAVVNGKAITKQAFAKEMDRIRKRFSGKGASDDRQIARIETEVLDILVGGELLFQASRKKGISVSTEETTKELETIRQKFPGSDELKQTFDEEDIRRKLAIEKFIDAEFSAPTVITDEESRKYYEDNKNDFTKPEQVLASHILVKVEESTPESERKKAKSKILDVQKKLATGAAFDELAKKYSEDSTAKNGGSLGYFMRGQMVQPFEQTAFAMEPGQTSEIVETRFGYHIIRVIDKKPYSVIPYEEVAEKLKGFIKQQRVQAKVNQFIKDQKDNATIEILLSKKG